MNGSKNITANSICHSTKVKEKSTCLCVAFVLIFFRSRKRYVLTSSRLAVDLPEKCRSSIEKKIGLFLTQKKKFVLNLNTQTHDYQAADANEQSNVDNQVAETVDNESAAPDTALHEQIDEKTEDNDQTVISNEENNVNIESEWQSPISLKGFKKKLNEIFIVKYVYAEFESDLSLCHSFCIHILNLHPILGVH